MLYGNLTFRQSIELIWRSRLWFFATLLILSILGMVICMQIPPTYTGTATLLFARPDLETEKDRGTHAVDVAGEITASGARILTLENLRGIAKQRLYAGADPGGRELDEAAVSLLDNIRVELLHSAPGKTDNTVGFTIRYNNRSAAVARAVVGDLVAMYLNDSDSEGARGSAAAVRLLQEEGSLLKQHVKTLEAEIAAYKEKNAATLPELHVYNLKYLSMLKQDLADLQRKIRDHEERRGQRSADLAETRPTSYIYTDDGKRLYTPAEQLELLEARYVSKAAHYTPRHPDMVAMKRTMKALRHHIANPHSAVGDALTAKVAEEVFDITPVLKKPQPVLRSYPKVTPTPTQQQAPAGKAEANPPGLRQGRGDGKAAPAVVADNPGYLRLRTELDSIDREIALMKASESDIRGKILEVEKLLSRAPEVERQLGEMMRLYESTAERLTGILQHEFDARLEATIEANGAGTRFVVAEPTRVPDIPGNRKRNMLAILSILLALAVSSVLALVRGMHKRVIYDMKSLEQLSGFRAVVAVPKLNYAHA